MICTACNEFHHNECTGESCTCPCKGILQKPDMKYGIRMLTTEWACENGGDDYTGTQEEMKAIIHTWITEGVPKNVRYQAIPYSGQDGIPPKFPAPPENARNSRMKR